MSVSHFQASLEALGEAMRDVESALEEMRAEQDALAGHIFIARRHYRKMPDVKSDKRRATAAG